MQRHIRFRDQFESARSGVEAPQLFAELLAVGSDEHEDDPDLEADEDFEEEDELDVDW